MIEVPLEKVNLSNAVVTDRRFAYYIADFPSSSKTRWPG